MSRYGGEPRYGGYERGGGVPERWNPERFERERVDRSRGPALVERDRYEEHDFFQPRPARTAGGPHIRERSAEGYYGRPGMDRFAEKDVYFRQERYGPPARRPRARYYEEEDFDSFEEEPSRGQMVSFEKREDYRPSSRRAPPRPGLLRRQSSLDTFDRKPLPRYGAPLRPPPETIVMPAGGRRRPSPPRYVERGYEERDLFEEDYHGGYRERERSTVRRKGNSDVEFREEFREEESYDVEDEEVEKPYPRKGKTKMPKRLVNKRAIIELGYPFDEEGETIIILKALAKEHIDEVIKLSKEMNERGESRTTYLIEAPAPAPAPEAEVVERRTEIIVSPPDKPPSEVPRSVREWDMMSGSGVSTVKGGGHGGGSHAGGSHAGGTHAGGGHAGGHSSKGGHSTKGSRSVRALSVSARSEHGGGHSEHGGDKSVHEVIHAEHHSEHGGHSDHHSRASHRSPSPTIITRKPSRSRSRHRSRSMHYVEEEVGESDKINTGPLAMVLPHHSKKDERSIKAEIRALEAEKKMLKYEREIEKEHRKSSRYRDDGEVIIERSSRHREPEIVIERPEREVKIEKDRKAPTPGMLKAMLATLT